VTIAANVLPSAASGFNCTHADAVHVSKGEHSAKGPVLLFGFRMMPPAAFEVPRAVELLSTTVG
jgi:hypothetical protein